MLASKTALDVDDWAFAEFVARTGLEPEFAGRYLTEADALLGSDGVTIEDLARVGPVDPAWCVLCTGTFAPPPPPR
jgi:hypothetical protein